MNPSLAARFGPPGEAADGFDLLGFAEFREFRASAGFRFDLRASQEVSRTKELIDDGNETNDQNKGLS